MDKKQEFAHLMLFKEICSFFPVGEIECTDKPDFLIHNKDRIIGIEHTRIYQPGLPNGASLQAQDSEAQKIVKKASDIYIQNQNKPLFVQIMFHKGRPINKRRVNQFAEIIYRLIVKEPILPGQIIILHRTHENSKYFPSEIARILIYSHPNGKENMWCISSGGSIPEITVNQVNKKISDKEQEIDIYKGRCSDIWLLIVAENIRIPTTLDISRDAATHSYHTKFDRIFLLWFAIRKYIEFNITY
jgi:hypothetical protein